MEMEAGNPRQLGNSVTVELNPGIEVDLDYLDRHFYTTSNCGVYGALQHDPARLRFNIYSGASRIQMKLRIHGNSLRLSLSQSEVAQFSKTGFVEDSTQFAPEVRFTYTIESSSSLPAPKASYQDHWLRIEVPSAAAKEWFTTDRIAISADQPIGSGTGLSILIEKDFQCSHGGEQRDPDTYPNPLEETTPQRG